MSRTRNTLLVLQQLPGCLLRVFFLELKIFPTILCSEVLYLNHFLGPLHLHAVLYLTICYHEQWRHLCTDYSKLSAVIPVLIGSVQDRILLLSEKTKRGLP